MPYIGIDFGTSNSVVANFQYGHAEVLHNHEGQKWTPSVVTLRRDGTLAWKRVVKEEWPHEGGHLTGSLANNSPLTDGEMVYAFFGSRGLYAFDLDGNLKWQKDLGRMHTLHAHGEGSSPVLHGDTLVVCWDHEAGSFLYALDKHTGKTLWKVPRDEKTS